MIPPPDVNYQALIQIITDPTDFSSFFDNDIGMKEQKKDSQSLKEINPKDNPVWQEITHRFGTNIKQPELLSIALILSSHFHIKIDRDAKRRKGILIKWFQENWNVIQPFLNNIVLEEQKAPNR